MTNLISRGRSVSNKSTSGDASASSASQSAAGSASDSADSRRERERCNSGLGVKVGVTGIDFAERCGLRSLFKNGETCFVGRSSSRPTSHGVSLHSKSLRARLLVLFFFPKLSLIFDIGRADMDGRDEIECVREGTLWRNAGTCDVLSACNAAAGKASGMTGRLREGEDAVSVK